MLMQVGQVLKMEIEEGKGFSCKACQRSLESIPELSQYLHSYAMD